MAKQTRQKPRKPRPDFPLYAHTTGRWAKKIRQKTHFFGPWEDPEGALNKYLDQKDDLQAGRKPRAENDGRTIEEIVNTFLDAKAMLMESGELNPKTFEGYRGTGRILVGVFGRQRLASDLRVEDFEGLRRHFAKDRGPIALGNQIQRTRTIFKHAFESGLIDVPLRFGPTFKRPSKRILRQARHARGLRMFERDELLAILEKADGQLRAMILLGIQAGFGATDCASLPKSAVNLETGWIDFPRPKTAVRRLVPLWPETLDALREVMGQERKSAKNSADNALVFLTRFGRPWTRMKRKRNPKPGEAEWIAVDSIGLMFAKMLRDLGIKRPGVSFYALRHSFETHAGESRDQPAVDAIMGHDPGDMASLYRERISDERLRAVVDHVRDWLWREVETEGEAE